MNQPEKIQGRVQEETDDAILSIDIRDDALISNVMKLITDYANEHSFDAAKLFTAMVCCASNLADTYKPPSSSGSWEFIAQLSMAFEKKDEAAVNDMLDWRMPPPGSGDNSTHLTAEKVNRYVDCHSRATTRWRAPDDMQNDLFRLGVMENHVMNSVEQARPAAIILFTSDHNAQARTTCGGFHAISVTIAERLMFLLHNKWSEVHKRLQLHHFQLDDVPPSLVTAVLDEIAPLKRRGSL